MTDTMFTRTALTEAAKAAGVTADQARAILEAAGVTVQPEKPALPVELGSAIIATEIRGEEGEWTAFLQPGGDWLTSERVNGRRWHRPEQITAWTEARVIPATAAPVTLTEDQVGELYDAVELGDTRGPWKHLPADSLLREHVTATVNTALAQYAAPAEGEPIADAAKLIDPHDVRGSDRVRLVLENGDEATFTVRYVADGCICSRKNAYHFSTIRAVHLLHREEA